MLGYGGFAVALTKASEAAVFIARWCTCWESRSA